jgi:DNA-binding XRE family transcriptional regulator
MKLTNYIGVEETTISSSENNRSRPEIYLFPKIIEFLEYVPIELPRETIRDKIKVY